MQEQAMDETRLKAQGDACSPFLFSRQTHFSLHGRMLMAGDWLEVSVFGHWIPGRVEVDAGGWYLQTLDHVGIRLSNGLRARLVVDPLSSASEILQYPASCKELLNDVNALP